MPTLMKTSAGKLIFRNGKFGLNQSCCCGPYIPPAPEPTCCEEVWGIDYPPLLNLVVTNSCCPDMNRTIELRSFGTPTDLYWIGGYSIFNAACNDTSIANNLTLHCDGGVWVLRTFAQLITTLTLVSCSPLRLIGSVPDAYFGIHGCFGNPILTIVEP